MASKDKFVNPAVADEPAPVPGVEGGLSATGKVENKRPERGDAADNDIDRAEQGGRHYGRSGPEEPGPHSGRGLLQPDKIPPPGPPEVSNRGEKR